MVGLGRSHSQLVIAKDVSESFRRALRKGLEERDAKKKQGVLSPTKIEEKKQIMSKLAGGQIFDHNQFQRSLSSRTAFGAPYDHNSSIASSEDAEESPDVRRTDSIHRQSTPGSKKSAGDNAKNGRSVVHISAR